MSRARGARSQFVVSRLLGTPFWECFDLRCMPIQCFFESDDSFLDRLHPNHDTFQILCRLPFLRARCLLGALPVIPHPSMLAKPPSKLFKRGTVLRVHIYFRMVCSSVFMTVLFFALLCISLSFCLVLL